MKTSEMTNEELAKHIECGDAILREAAARLRTFTLLSKAHQRLANDSVDYESNLLKKLKVAEEALVVTHDRMTTATLHEELSPTEHIDFVRRIASNALAAIREEGGTDAD